TRETEGRERRVGATVGKDFVEMLEGAGAAGRDHGNRHGGGDRGSEPAIEAAARPVAIDRRQQDLSGAALGGLDGPLDGFTRRLRLAAAGVDVEAIAVPLGV